MFFPQSLWYCSPFPLLPSYQVFKLFYSWHTLYDNNEENNNTSLFPLLLRHLHLLRARVLYILFLSFFFSFLCSNTGLTLQSPADKERYNTECFVAIALTFLYLLSFLPIFIWFLLLFSSQIQYCNGLRKKKKKTRLYVAEICLTLTAHGWLLVSSVNALFFSFLSLTLTNTEMHQK